MISVALVIGALIAAPAPDPAPAECAKRTRASALVLVPSAPDISVQDGELEAGDVLAALTPTGECAGAAVWTEAGAVLAVWEDDPFTPVLDGMLLGDPITFVAYDMSAGSPAASASVRLEAVYGGAEGYASDDLYVVGVRETLVDPGGGAVEALVLGPSFPNPVPAAATTIPMGLGAPGHVALDVFDALGRHVRRVLDREMAEGAHRIEVDASELAPGLYVVRASTGDAVALGRFTVAR